MGDSQQPGQSATAVHRLECSVDWSPGNVAAYVVDCAEPVMFDAGMEGEEERDELLADLESADMDFSDVEHLVITHPHWDHVGQVPTVLEAADPTVYAPASIRPRFERDLDDLGAAVRRNARAAGVMGSYLEEAVEMSVESLERDRTLLPNDAVDRWIDRGESFTVGPLTVEAVHTPGHQADHLCYLTDVDDERVLFSGDMALSTFRPVAMHTGFDDGYEEAIDAYYTAVDRLAELAVDYVYTGHDDPHGEFQAAVRDDRESLDRLLERTREELDESTGKTAVEIAMQRSGNRDIRYLVIETASALAKLERDGEAALESPESDVKQYVLTS